MKGCLELGVRYVSLLESEASWADKSFVLRRFPREALADEGNLRRDNKRNISIKLVYMKVLLSKSAQADPSCLSIVQSVELCAWEA